MTGKKEKWRKLRGRKQRMRNPGIPLLIGVLPLERGSGATQLSIMLANFLTAKEREKGIVILQRRETVAQLARVMGCEEKERLMIKGIEFQAYEPERMTQILNGGYEFVLWCFDGTTQDQWEEFLRCNRHLVVCNHSEWHPECVTEFIKENRSMGGFSQWKFLASFGPGEHFKELKRKTGVTIEKIPWCEDPFFIKREWFSFLEALV